MCHDEQEEGTPFYITQYGMACLSCFESFMGIIEYEDEDEDNVEDSAPMDTYMDTSEQSKNKNTRNSLKSWWASRDLNPGPDDYESSALTK